MQNKSKPIMPDLSILDSLDENAPILLKNKESDESEPDDFMSDAFISQAEQVDKSRTIDLNLSYIEKRRRDLITQNERGYNKPKFEVEKEAREAALERNLLEDASTSKAARMMKLMGYKDGSKLGKEIKNDNGLSQPIKIELKLDKTGLGHAEAIKRKAHAAYEESDKRLKIQDTDYRVRVKEEFEMRQTIGRLRACQRICEQLDMQNGIEENYLWVDLVNERNEKIERRKLANEEKQVEEDYEDETVPGSRPLETVESFLAPSMENENIQELSKDYIEFSSLEPKEQLRQILNHLRSIYQYCFWCGTRYESQDELSKICPGPFEPDHD